MLGEVSCDSLFLAKAGDLSLEHRKGSSLEWEVDFIPPGLRASLALCMGTIKSWLWDSISILLVTSLIRTYSS